MTNLDQLDLFGESSKIKLPPKIIALDVEGTGDKEPDLIELAVVSIENGIEIVDSKSWLMKPKKKITFFAQKIHGISNKDVKNLPAFNQFEDNIRKVLGDHSIVAHNAPVDFKLLKRKIPDWNPVHIFDTLRLSRRIITGIKSYSLKSLIQELDLDNIIKKEVSVNIHRALYDAYAAACLFIYLYNTANEQKMDKETFYKLAQIPHREN